MGSESRDKSLSTIYQSLSESEIFSLTFLFLLQSTRDTGWVGTSRSRLLVHSGELPL